PYEPAPPATKFPKQTATTVAVTAIAAAIQRDHRGSKAHVGVGADRSLSHSAIALQMAAAPAGRRMSHDEKMTCPNTLMWMPSVTRSHTSTARLPIATTNSTVCR